MPQGSVLGPVLFLLYINDIDKSSKLIDFVLFADDTCLFIKDSKVGNISQINKELTFVCDWLIANRLSLNVSKSNFLFHSNTTEENLEPIYLLGEKLKPKSNTKYLGIIIDDKLSWKTHIDYVVTKASQGFGAIRKIKYLLPKNCLTSVYSSLFQCHLDYGNLVWGSPSNKQFSKLNKIVQRCHKFLKQNNTDKDELLTLSNLYKLNVCKFIYDSLNRQLPDNLKDIHAPANLIHNHGTRLSEFGLHVPHRKNKTFPLTYQGPLYWNELCQDLSSKPSKLSFTRNLKIKLIDQQNL